jgi:hypothetical protein
MDGGIMYIKVAQLIWIWRYLEIDLTHQIETSF